MITFHNATLLKKGKQVFQQLNLVIEDNTHYVIRGSNGSGKTNLLEALAGQLSAIEGKITYSFIDDHLSWDERFHLRRQYIHYIPTHALQAVMASHPDYFYQQRYYTIGDVNLPTVRDFLGKNTPFDQTTFPKSFNVEKLLSLEITRLSNGQLKKVLIIRELLRGIPKMLLLDYPLDGLDADSRTDLCDFIDTLAKDFDVQILLSDNGHQLPTVITQQIIVDKFGITKTKLLIANEREHKSMSTPGATQVSSDVVVEMKDVQIKYGSHVVVERLNWCIHAGERWALTGRNGSGKTTIFSLIFADHPMAYSQQVSLFGKRRGSGESIWDIKNRINYLGPEQLHYFNTTSINKTGRQYLLEQHEGEKVLLVLNFFAANSFIDEDIRTYSSGQMQLLLIMSSFLSKKPLLLLDEPFQFLDSETKERVNLFLERQLEAETTLILITHDERDVAQWAHLRLHLE
jgi:molybdate transport system ATP-binding protein